MFLPYFYQVYIYSKVSYIHYIFIIAVGHVYSWNPYITVFLTLTVLVATIDAQWEGMGDVGSARYEPTLLPPSLTIRVFKLQ